MADFSFITIPSNECIGNSLSTINLNFNSASYSLSSLNTNINAVSAHSLNTVQRIVAGSNIIISPLDGTGIVTISSIAVNGETPTGQEILSATNVGVGGVGVYKQKVGQELQFKKLVSGGSNVRLEETGDTIKVTAFDRSGSAGGESNTASSKGDGLSLVLPKEASVLPFKSLKQGSGGISLSSTTNTIVVSNTLSAKNLGATGQIFKAKDGNFLTFKNLISGNKGIRIEDDPSGNSIKLSVLSTISAKNIGNGSKVFDGLEYVNNDQSRPMLNFKTLVSGSNFISNDSPCDVRFANTANSIQLTVYDNVSATHVGGTGGKIFKQKQNNLLQFRTIRGTGQITVANSQQNTNEIVIGLQTGVLSSTIIGVNTNVPGAAVFKERNGPELVFRRLAAGTGMLLTENDDSVIISSTGQGGGSGDITGGLNLGGGTGIFDSKSGTNLQFKTLSSATPLLSLNENLATKVISLSVGNVVTMAQNNPSTNGVGVFQEKVEGALIFKKIVGGTGITVEDSQSPTGAIVIKSTATTPPPVVEQKSAGFKNKFVNGNFDIWQRNTITNSISDTDNSTTPKFLADRFGFFAGNRLTGGSGIQTSTLSCVGLTLNDTLAIASRPTYCQRIILNQRATGNAVPTTFLQRVENVLLLAGKQVTLTFWARSNNTGTSNFPVFYQQAYKVSPAPTLKAKVSVGTVNLTSAWTKYTMTFTVSPIDPAIWANAWSGPIADAKWNSYTQISFEIPGNSGRYVDITGMQLEEGSTATDFEQRPESAEFALCQRYYQKEDRKYHVFPAGPWSEASHTIRIPSMRTNPVVTHTIHESQRLGASGNPPFKGTKDQLFFLYDHDAVTTSAGWVWYSWTADAEF